MVVAGIKVPGPGRLAPTRLLLLALAAALPSPAAAQPRPAPAANPAVPAPDRLTALKLLWSTMAAVDQANRTGNYSVLRDIGSAGFQAANDQAALGAVFASLRAQQLDLGDTLVVMPVWEIAPTMVDPRTLRMRGSFPLRPAIAFDLIFTWDRRWRLHGVAVQAQPPVAR